MATKRCYYCMKEIKRFTFKCPHCRDVTPFGLLVCLIFGLVSLGVIGRLIYMTTQVGKEFQEEDAVLCASNLHCWGEKNSIKATVFCGSSIEQLAKHDYKWTNSVGEYKFSKFMWKDRDEKTLTYIGDKIKFQNGFGVWVNHVYECDFNPNTNTVIGVRVREGTL